MSTRKQRIDAHPAEPTDGGVRGRREQRTIHDVARRAKVSIGTVSKALNDKGRLRKETRERIIAAAKAIDYRPNDLAQSLHRARSMTVGILSTDSFGRFSFPIVAAIERRLFDHGVAVFMCNATDDPSRERRHIDQLLGKRVDGLVVTARRVDRRKPIEPEVHGLPAQPSLSGRWSEAWGREAAQMLFARRRGAPDALFCGNDPIARGAIEALREMGLEAPADVAVVGFDNWDVMAEATRPPLTSVDMNLETLGREAGAALLEMMAGRRFIGVRRLPCSLVVRGSCGAIPLKRT